MTTARSVQWAALVKETIMITMRAVIVIYIIVTLLFCIPSFGQQKDSLFQVSEGVLTNSMMTKIEILKKTKRNLYEDENYLVRGTCSGEWGGSIRFKNRRTGIEHSASATCPISVNRINDKYYITNSLAHLSGSCEVLEISHPDSMEVFKMPPPRKKKGKTIYHYVGDDESKSKKGTRTIIDRQRVLALGSFVLNGSLFHIVTRGNQTFIATIENEDFRKVKFITSEEVFTYDNGIIKMEGHLLLPIFRGYLDVFKNQIIILRKE